MDKLLTPTEVKDILCVTRQTLHAIVKSGKLKYVAVGFRKRFRKADVEAYLDGEARGETHEPKD